MLRIHFTLHTKLFACIDPFASIAQRWDLPVFRPVDFLRVLLNPPDRKLVITSLCNEKYVAMGP